MSIDQLRRRYARLVAGTWAWKKHALETRCVTVCLFFLLAVMSVWAVNPHTRISQYGHTAWRIQDGFIAGIPIAIAQTADGYLWIGGSFGLLRFDGVRFVPWTPPLGERLLSPEVYRLLAARDGSLWIGTIFGLSHWNGHELANYSSRGNTYVSSIVEDDDGTIWITWGNTPKGGSGPLCQVKGTTMQCHGESDGIPDLRYDTLVRDSARNFWMGGSTSLTRWKPGSYQTYYPSGLKSNAGQAGVTGFVSKSDGSLLMGIAVGGPGLGLQQLVQGAWKPFVVPQLDGSTLEVNELFQDRQNALWVGTASKGIYRIYGGVVDHFGSSEGLSSDAIQRVFEDQEGNLWVATSKGVDCFRDLQVVTFSVREGLTTPEVDSVQALRDGSVWIGGAFAFDFFGQGRFVSVRSGEGLPGNQVTSLFEDHAGQRWVGVDNTLNIYEKGRFEKINKRDGTPMGMVFGMTEDADNNVWVLSGVGSKTLIRISGRKVQEELSESPIPAASSLVADSRGGIWLGLLNGDLARYQRGRADTFHYEHNPNSEVQQVLVTSDGSVLGAGAFGLLGWSNGKEQMLSARNGLPCDTVHSFAEAATGALWLYMQCGLVEITTSDLQRWWTQPNVKLQPRVLDVFDGLQPGAPVPFENKAVKTPDGRLWFANSQVLQMIDPVHLARNLVPPAVHIEQVIADRKGYSPQGDVYLPAHTRDVEIDYTALSFAVPQKVRFRYKLEGRDTDWQEPGTRRQAFYTDLRPGPYRFHVVACNNDGVWNNDGAMLEFNIMAAWYQTNWFRACIVIAFLLSLWAMYQLRLRQLNLRMEARIGERTRIARELHDTLLQNLHGAMFQFQAARNMFHKRPEEAMQTLDGAIAGTERAIAESEDAIQDLRSEAVAQSDLAESLTMAGNELASSRNATGTAPIFSVVVEGDRQSLVPAVQAEVYRIGREVLRNAFRHAEAHRIETEIRFDDHDFRLRIRDDGKGIDSKVLEEGKRTGHWGLSGLRERAEKIGANLDLWSKPGAGTEVQLTVPSEIAYETRRDSRVRPFRKGMNS